MFTNRLKSVRRAVCARTLNRCTKYGQNMQFFTTPQNHFTVMCDGEISFVHIAKVFYFSCFCCAVQFGIKKNLDHKKWFGFNLTENVNMLMGFLFICCWCLTCLFVCFLKNDKQINKQTSWACWSGWISSFSFSNIAIVVHGHVAPCIRFFHFYNLHMM